MALRARDMVLYWPLCMAASGPHAHLQSRRPTIRGPRVRVCPMCGLC